MEIRDLGLGGFALGLALAVAGEGGCASSDVPVSVASTGGDGGGRHAASSSRASTAASTTASTGGGGAGGGASAAKQFYLDHVFHDLYDAPNSATDPRACGGCHGDPPSNGAPTYLEPDPEASYAVTTIYPGFLAAPSSSLLVERGSIEHTGPGMNAAQLADVKQWLTMEALERGLAMGTGGGGGAGGGATVDSLEQAIEDYGACMDHALWLAPGAGVGLDKLPKATVMGGATCMSCHATGMGGNWLSGDDDETFAKNQTFPYVLRQVTGTVDAMGSFDTLVSAKRWIDKGSEVCDPMVQTCHPKFTLSADLQAGINAFVNKTIQKWANHQCGAGGAGGA